jgi:hypothetical protein
MCSFSIIVINHNYGRFLAKAIDSALLQTVKATQIIVVDDGSTDDSAFVIARYENQITPVFIPASGHVAAVNAGYAAADADLYILLDADDVLYPTCLESVLRAWQPNDIKLQYRLDTIDGAGIDQKMPFPHFPADMTPDSVRLQSFQHGAYPWTVSSGNVFSRKLLDALLPVDPAEIYRSPDGYINKMAPLFGDVRSITDILGAYRVHGANVWAQPGHGMRMAPIIRWLKFDQVLQSKFEAEAKRRGIAVARYQDVATVQQMEYRLLALRFAPGEFDQLGLTNWTLFRRAAQAAARSANISLLGRLFWVCWFFVMAFLPRPAVQYIFGMARGHTGRNRISRLLVRLSRGSSATEASSRPEGEHGLDVNTASLD